MSHLDSTTPNASASREQQMALGVAIAAKKVLRCFHAETVEVQQYRLQEQDEVFTITALDGRGEILRMQGQQLDADLLPEDIAKFQTIKDELPQM